MCLVLTATQATKLHCYLLQFRHLHMIFHVVDRFYIALLSALKETHCTLVACNSKQVTAAFYGAFWTSMKVVYLKHCLVLTWLMSHETANILAPSVHYTTMHHVRMHAQLAVTCHQHFWLNDKDLLCCTDFVQEFHHMIFYVVLTVETFHHMMFYVVLTLCRNFTTVSFMLYWLWRHFTTWRVMLYWLCAGISPHDLLCCTDYGDISPHDVLCWTDCARISSHDLLHCTDFVQEFHHCSVINSLLSLLQLAFCCPLVDIRTQAFRSWRIVIDIFAEKSECLNLMQ